MLGINKYKKPIGYNTPEGKIDSNAGGNIRIEPTRKLRGDEDTQDVIREGNNVAMANVTSLGGVSLTEVTTRIFSQMKKGEICRYGNTGWIIRCPECGNLIITEDDTHKTYISPDNQLYRLSPSLVCPREECTWHVFATITPETAEIDKETDAKATTEEESTDTESVI